MNILTWFKSLQRFAVKNAPHLLMGTATAASISALIFAVKATPKACIAKQEEQFAKARDIYSGNRPGKLEPPNHGAKMFHNGSFYTTDGTLVEFSVPELTIPELIKACAKYYAPAAAMELLALVCFWAAHGIDIRRQAVLSGLCATAEQALQEYQRKVQQMLGDKAEKQVRQEIAQDNASKLPPMPRANDDAPPGCTDRWCVIMKGGVASPYFKSNYIKIKDAQNEINHEMIANMYASEADLYWLLDPEHKWLKVDGYSGQLGWDVDRMLELEVHECDGPDHEPIYIINYKDKYGSDYFPTPQLFIYSGH